MTLQTAMKATQPTPLKFPITGTSALCKEVRARGLHSFEQLIKYVRSLPYGRPTDGNDPCAVLRERRGTCSSKHRLLAAVAHDCDHAEVQLMVGIFAMCEANTPGVGTVLDAAGLTSIPEAHCYLKINGQRFDFTGLPSGAVSPFESLVTEHVVAPAALADLKIRFHKDAIAAWAPAHGLTAQTAWRIREACIAALACPSSKPARLNPA